MDTAALLRNIGRLARFDMTAFQDLRGDRRYLYVGAGVLITACLLYGLGALFFYLVDDPLGGRGKGDVALKVFFLGSVFAMVLWFAWIAITFTALSILKVTVNIEDLATLLLYASLPLVIGLFFFIPGIGFALTVLPVALVLVYGVYATRAATGDESWKVIAATVAGFAVWVAVLSVLGRIGDEPLRIGFAPGVFALSPG
jgi:hypothetical protein